MKPSICFERGLDMKIAVIHGGTRANGNTEMLTKLVIKGLVAEEIFLKDYVINPIEDKRHTEEGFHEIKDNYNEIIEKVMNYDILIFATPIYWYSMTGTMKNFIDRWSHTSRDSKYPHFKNKMKRKKAYVVAVGGDDPSIKGLPLIQQFQYIFQFIGMQFEDYILGKGYQPGDIFEDKQAVTAAQVLQGKIKRFKEGNK